MVSRTTYDLTKNKNQIIEHISINKQVGAATLHRKLPPRVFDIRLVLHYKDKSDRKGSKDDELISNRVSKKPKRDHGLSNRKGKVSRGKKTSKCYRPGSSGTSNSL